MSSEIISFLMKKVDMQPTPKRGRMLALFNNGTHMRPLQIT